MNAQDDDSDPTYPLKGDKEFSVHIGYNSAFITEPNRNTNNNSESVTGLFAGARADFYWSDRWSFQTGVYYDEKGYTFNDFDGVKLSYVALPLNVNWHFGKNRRWNLNFGPNVSLLLSADDNGTDVKDFYKSIDIGLDLGIGHKIPIGDNYIQLSLNGLGGIINIFDIEGDSPLEARNNRSNLAVGFIF